MLGYSLFSNLNEQTHLSVFGTVRSITGKEKFFSNLQQQLITDVDVYNISSLQHAIETVAPDVVINCVGLIKQHDISKQHIDAIKINALLPHEIANICNRINAKMIHFSTDCVFTGDVGLYNEDSLPNAHDLYGKSKCLGEVSYGKHLTLRTSIIGHELTSSVSLVNWFLSQSDSVKGFSKAVFSGLPTCYIAKLLVEYIFPNPEVVGLMHLSADPIDKYSLLKLISLQYKKEITIAESKELFIDRSLNSDKFRQLTQFSPPLWAELVQYMYTDYLKRYKV